MTRREFVAGLGAAGLGFGTLGVGPATEPPNQNSKKTSLDPILAKEQNHIARWLIAMHDATGKGLYREHARQWWQVMKSRMQTREGGKYFVWNYWEPAGPWDLNPDGSPHHWVGVHPNEGYYEIDLEGIVAAFEHGLVFTREDIQRLIATNRDFM